MTNESNGLPRLSHMTVADMGDSKLIFIAGLVAENSALSGEDQISEVLSVVEKLLGGVGARPSHIVSIRILLAGLDNFSAMKLIWERWAGEHHVPARATVGAKLLINDWKIEVDVTAAFTPIKPCS